MSVYTNMKPVAIAALKPVMWAATKVSKKNAIVAIATTVFVALAAYVSKKAYNYYYAPQKQDAEPKKQDVREQQKGFVLEHKTNSKFVNIYDCNCAFKLGNNDEGIKKFVNPYDIHQDTFADFIDEINEDAIFYQENGEPNNQITQAVNQGTTEKKVDSIGETISNILWAFTM